MRLGPQRVSAIQVYERPHAPSRFSLISLPPMLLTFTSTCFFFLTFSSPPISPLGLFFWGSSFRVPAMRKEFFSFSGSVFPLSTLCDAPLSFSQLALSSVSTLVSDLTSPLFSKPSFLFCYILPTIPFS